MAANSAAIDPAALTAELVRFPSVTPRDAGAIAHLAHALERVGFACEMLEFAEPGTEKVLNLYARLGKSGRNLCFAGHTDVVPPGNAANWSVDPFAGSVKDGVLIGRGAADMKSAIACFAAATERFVASRGPEFGGSISLLITGDEEAVAINGTRKVLEFLAKRGEKLDASIVGEPTSRKELGDMIKIGRRGSLNGTLTAFGVQGHTAYPHFADNAAHRLVRMLDALTREPIDQGSAQFEPSNLQVATIDIGNPAANIIPDRAKAVFNVRFNDRWTGTTMESWVRERLDRVDGKYELKIQVSGESFLVPRGEVSDKLSRAIEAVTGRKPALSTGGGTSDARFIQRYCPVAEFGLVGETAHKVNERVSINDIEALTKIYSSFLELYFAGR
ncbi:MAG: succinyl-diaminopimelate desuccinylase [Alphaproteobacteria bacterium]|nr:succinyl-diaminopimelate desuccinylase [Alphaproteobacteria bacterium]